MSKPILFSFFSGAGFLDLGFEHNGFDIQFVNENHIPFLDAYQYSRKRLNLISPIHGYNNKNIEEFLEGSSKVFLKDITIESQQHGLVGFIGGPPCPDFSVGGKNKGAEGDHGKLTKVYIEVIINNMPDFFIFENVKGLWRTNKHREFYELMKDRLINAGYLLTNRLINSIEYGAPQDRDRIILFGIKSNLAKNVGDIDSIFPWEKYLKFDKKILKATTWPQTDKYEPESKIPPPENIKNLISLTTQYWFDKNDVENHFNANDFFQPRAGLAKFKVIPEGDDSKKSYKRLHRWRYSPTAAYGNNEVHLHPYKNRRLSVSEALAIQSLPKEFSLPEYMTLSNKFKTIGNGVPYLAASGLAKTVNEFVTNLK